MVQLLAKPVSILFITTQEEPKERTDKNYEGNPLGQWSISDRFWLGAESKGLYPDGKVFHIKPYFDKE